MRAITCLILLASLTAWADTEDSVRKSISAKPGGRLIFSTAMGPIQVTPGSDTVEVEAHFRGNPNSRQEFDRMLKDITLDVSQAGNDIRVTPRFQGVWTGSRPGFSNWFGWGGHNWCHRGGCLEYTWLREMDFRIRVPQQFNVELETAGGSIKVGDLKGEVRARTSGGSLHFGRIDGPVDGRTSGGSIEVLGARGRTSVHTSGGSIRIEETSGEVEADTSGGAIHIERTSGRVEAHTSGGSIRVNRVQGPVSASTSGGGITVALSDGRGYDVDAETSGGGVTSDFSSLAPRDRERHRVQGQVNGGGSAVRLRTSGGGIHIRRAA
jgi:hypothetical protein